MSFVNTSILLYTVSISLALLILFSWLNLNFFKWIKTYWFYDRTWINRLSFFCYILSLFLILASLLDLRGGEQKIKTNIPDQKTIIVLDNSLSMLCEDIRPSRFSKSIQLARHFVKNAPGHKIAIVLFSDNQKRVLPFTDDIDLIDARLSSLDKTNSVSGGTNISQAITEAVQYFEADSDEDSKEISGNLLVFTDSEEGDENFKLDIPTNINLAVVGVGTLSGGNIPLRWENNSFRGYKTFKGENVITKLDENYIKQMGKNTKNFKYWIVNSYSIPTDEIMNFLRASYSKKLGSGDIRIRPVLSHFILIPAILLYCLSVILGRFPLFKV